MKALLSNYYFLSALIFACACAEQDDSDAHLNKYIEDCLADTGLNVHDLGIDKVEDLREDTVEALRGLEEAKRGCFVACIFQKRGIITGNGTLTKHLPLPDPNKNFTTSYEDAIDACRGERNVCKLGGCLYGVYF